MLEKNVLRKSSRPFTFKIHDVSQSTGLSARGIHVGSIDAIVEGYIIITLHFGSSELFLYEWTEKPVFLISMRYVCCSKGQS